VEKETVKAAPQKPKATPTKASVKPKATSTASKSSKSKVEKATASKPTSSIAKIGRKVPDPKPIVYVAPVEISISAHKVPKYTDKN